jgi:hypothetical protein
MNIIQKQAITFTNRNMRDHRNYKDFISDVRTELWEYNKVIYKIEFLEKIILEAKIKYDEHLKICTQPEDCSKNIFYENVMFFLQEELEELEQDLTPVDFNQNEKKSTNEVLKKILDDLNEIKVGQEVSYNDLSDGFDELKDLYFLNKKNWMQLFNGKVSEMVAAGVVSETVSKDIVKILAKNYDKLIVS